MINRESIAWGSVNDCFIRETVSEELIAGTTYDL